MRWRSNYVRGDYSACGVYEKEARGVGVIHGVEFGVLVCIFAGRG
jgi:hypothetical protein